MATINEHEKIRETPAWNYKGQNPAAAALGTQGEDPILSMLFPDISTIDLGTYSRPNVSNLDDEQGRQYFDMGLRLLLSYQHELAARCFLACIERSKYCALAHGFVALCHSPNYNFKGEAYYESTHHPEDAQLHDLLCIFPSQQVADRHSRIAIETIEELRKMFKRSNSNNTGGKSGKGGKKGKSSSKNKNNNNKSNGGGNSSSNNISNGNNGEIPLDANGVAPSPISDVETLLLMAIRKLTCHPGLEHSLSYDIVGRPYADAMRAIHTKYPNDPEIAYYFAESLMVLNAWQLYEYPSGEALSPDVEETKAVLERALALHKDHAGLCHMYVHLTEMSANPGSALTACAPLRNQFPHAGHLIHMPTHIDVLVGDYENCVVYNCKAITADMGSMATSPATAGRESFYFGYIVHNYHMAVYGAILGAYEAKAMELAYELIKVLDESAFEEYPDLAAYLESYSALDIHVLVRFGRWEQILELKPPNNKRLMLFRAATTKFAKGLALANLGRVAEAKREANIFDSIRGDPEAAYRILHNNTVDNLLAVDAVMLRGEIAYHEGKHDEGFDLLRKAVKMQDNLLFDEPWGKMQPIRHALGGLLLEQNQLEEAEAVFRKDLKFHPRNPWALVGLIRTLEKGGDCCCANEEIANLKEQLRKQRESELADFDVQVACACCQKSS